jgi:hypothetical protein
LGPFIVTAATNDPAPKKHLRLVTPRRLILGILLLIPKAMVGVRAYEVLSTPSVGEPFDVDAFTSYKVPDERNAFLHFKKAAELLVASHKVLEAYSSVHPQTFAESEGAAAEGWELAIPAVRTWVLVNRPALGEMQRGADCADCLECPLSTAASGGFLSIDWGPIRQCARLEAVEGARLTAEGHATQGWACYRNLLRTGRLLSMHTDLIGSISAYALGDLGVSGGAFWAAQKAVRAQELQRAIRDALTIEEMKTPNSDTIKVEYVKLRELATHGVIFGTTLRPWVRYTGYPAQLGRSARLVVANLLTQVDKPRYLRTPVHPGELRIFELDPMSPADPNLHPAKEVERSARSTAATVAKGLEHFAPEAASEIDANDPQSLLRNLYGAYQAQDLFQTERAGLLLALSLQLYYREQGAFPDRLEELVKNGCLSAIPIDPFGKGEPFRYRREGGPHGAAVVWSVWLDGIDQGGVDLHYGGSDWGIRVVPPGATVSNHK